jgi:tRNA(Ile)-lysidine synthase
MCELPGDGPAQWPAAGGWLRRYRGRLGFEPALAARTTAPEPRSALRRAGRYPLPGWGGVLVARRVGEGGVALSRLAASRCARRAARASRPRRARPSRSLKKQLPSTGVPAWARHGPLLLERRRAGVRARARHRRARAGRAGGAAAALHWEPAPAPEPRRGRAGRPTARIAGSRAPDRSVSLRRESFPWH